MDSIRADEYVKEESMSQAKLKERGEGPIALGVKPAIGSQLTHGGRGLLISPFCYTVKLQFGQLGALEPRAKGNFGALDQGSTEPGGSQNSRLQPQLLGTALPPFPQAIPFSLARPSTLDLRKYEIASRRGYNLNWCTHSKISSQRRG